MSRSWIPVVLVCLLCLEFGLGLRMSTRGSASFSSQGARLSRLDGIRFAIADLDGDWKPDLAVVETASLAKVEANYAIHLQLSAAPDISFLINAPSGGLRVAARDVNGDSLPDVVVSSVSDRRVVAILLNQGHGQFSKADPGSYLSTASDPDIFIRGCDSSICDKCIVASLRYTFDGERVVAAAHPVAVGGDSVFPADRALLATAEIYARRGRSPPALDFLS
jgi:hypothetical protein